MKNLLITTKHGFNNASIKLYSFTTSRIQRFRKEERGDAMGWVMGTFFGLLLLTAVYLLFREQINTFVKEKIFNKMGNLE